MDKAIVVTGGAGFIGSALAHRLGVGGLPIIAVDNLHPQIHPDRKRPDSLPEFAVLVKGDVTEAKTWNEVLAHWRPEILVHLAAETGTGQSLTEASRHANVNVVGTTAMLDALTRHGVKPRHVVLASSRAVYGEGAWCSESGAVFYPPPRSHAVLASGQWDPLPPDGNGKVTPKMHSGRDVFPAPTSVYGATKLAQEHILGAWCGAMQVPLSIFRLQNVYGPGQSPYNAYTGIITLFIRQARKGLQLEIYEDGEIGRDFVFIDDVVEAIAAGIAKPPMDRRLLDVGHGVSTTIREAATVIASHHAAPLPKVTGKFRDGDVRWAVADPEPLADQLGVRAKVPFEEGVRRVAEWLVEKGHA
ncbi:NAD-dependent epimerase/dehydratase family protein [Rhodanobacter denitrificans]|uniref:Nucleoside-diphosphate-sugar epimerase n=1 Tax=Rhodanobacter denitrificans TaxID=666685 RepID=M4NIV7_9GAMM|nr:NAD-dependent epimerase/dehydratase family protein [Rhodanobacter denitrificans]AGG87746.1 nucleoside-diphosphate-sugar epimerase [Rhodanobacter denitrificans]UJM86913.1 NAD-dependent epimerase/dehydratase family protein [Rhodanobacter denitrificans]